MEKTYKNLLSSKSFKEKDGEKLIVYTTENLLFYTLLSLIYFSGPILLIYLTKFMGPISTAMSTFVSIIALIFSLCFALPFVGLLLRGKCVLKISNGNLKNHKKSIPINQIKSSKIKKHPNPFKLWIFDYLVITDTNNKKHYFNLYNIVNHSTVLSMIDLYVFNKKDL